MDMIQQAAGCPGGFEHCGEATCQHCEQSPTLENRESERSPRMCPIEGMAVLAGSCGAVWET